MPQLCAATIPDYLDSVGLPKTSGRIFVTESAGRNRNYFVGDSASHPRWFIKQFRPGDAGYWAFCREREFVEKASPPAIAPVLADSDIRLLIYPAIGESLWKLLREGALIAADIPSRLLTALDDLRGRAMDNHRQLPPIVSCLIDPETATDLSLAQRRVLTSLLDADEPRRLATSYADAWDSGDQSTVHGDLKLEHVLIDKTGALFLVDWESIGSGPAQWDIASLLQAAISQVTLGIADWSIGHSTITKALAKSQSLGELAPLVALRMWQSAIEWAGGCICLPRGIGAICQCGISLAREPQLLERIVLAAEVT